MEEVTVDSAFLENWLLAGNTLNLLIEQFLSNTSFTLQFWPHEL